MTNLSLSVLTGRRLWQTTLFLFLVACPSAAEAQPRDAASYVLLAREKLAIASNATVDGSVGVTADQGLLKVSKDSTVTGVSAADRMKLGQATVFDIYANEIKIKPAVTQILGTPFVPIPAPVYQGEPLVLPDPFDPANYPAAFPITCGTQDVDVFEREPVTLSPGAYRMVRVKKRAELTLEPGTYHLCRLATDGDVTATGPVVLNIKERFLLGHDSSLLPQAGLGSADVQINLEGKRSVKIGEDSALTGRLMAPKAKLKIGNRAVVTGQLVVRAMGRGNGFTLQGD